jgi:integrase
MTDVRIASNVYRTATGFRVFVREPHPQTGRSTKVGKRFPPETPLEALIAYRDARQGLMNGDDADLDGVSGFTVDARRYLALEDVKAMPTYTDRVRQIGKWIAVFTDRPRPEIDKNAINDALHRFRKDGYSPSTVNGLRTALMSLWTTLDGRSSANPVRDAVLMEEPAMLPRGQDYDLLTMILDHVPDERGVRFDRKTLYGEVWADPIATVARRYGISGTFLSRICRTLRIPTPPIGHWLKDHLRVTPPPLPAGESGKRPSQLKSRARLEVLAWTGMDPGQLGRMTTADFSFIGDGWYSPPHRHKGRRGRRRTQRPVVRLPMTPESMAAFRRLVEVDGLGAFCARSLLKTWVRACRRVETKLRKDYRDPTFRIPHIRLKDLRHSFGTKLWRDTKGDEGTVAKMLGHAPGSPMTMRYALGAVEDVLRIQMKKFGGRKSGGGTAFARPKRSKVVPLTRKP